MLSIIIVNYKNPPLLRLCLTSLVRNLSKDFPYEIIVIDSQSTVETRNVVREEFQNVSNKIKLIPFEKNIGYTRGVNEGIGVSSGKYIININPDIVIQKHALEQMTAFIAAHPKIGLLGPRLLNFNDTTQQSCFRFYTPLTILYRRINHLPFASKILNKFLLKDKNFKDPLPVDWIMGSALLTTKEAINKVGTMDEQFFLYMSEVDWARRFWENGYTVLYYPCASFYHYHKRESKGRFGIFDIVIKRETRLHFTDAFRYFRKHGIKSTLSGNKPGS